MQVIDQKIRYRSLRYLLKLRESHPTAPRVVAVLAAFVGGVVDTILWAPVFTGAAILWCWLMIYRFDSPVMLIPVAGVWLAGAVWAAKIALTVEKKL